MCEKLRVTIWKYLKVGIVRVPMIVINRSEYETLSSTIGCL